MIQEVTAAKTYISRLPHGGDLLQELTRLCRTQNITLGKIEALGAVKKARIAYYDQKNRVYRFRTIDQHLEITCLIGNISLGDGEPIVHSHITLADSGGNAYGGHLAEGTIIFACEVFIQEFKGAPLKRGFDKTTGLPLWETNE